MAVFARDAFGPSAISNESWRQIQCTRDEGFGVGSGPRERKEDGRASRKRADQLLVAFKGPSAHCYEEPNGSLLTLADRQFSEKLRAQSSGCNLSFSLPQSKSLNWFGNSFLA